MFQIATADELVDFVKDFTGSTNTQEIKKCILHIRPVPFVLV